MGAAEDLEQLNDRLPFPSNVTISPSITVSLGRSAMPLGHCSKTTSEVFFGCVTRVARSVPTYDQLRDSRRASARNAIGDPPAGVRL